MRNHRALIRAVDHTSQVLAYSVRDNDPIAELVSLKETIATLESSTLELGDSYETQRDWAASVARQALILVATLDETIRQIKVEDLALDR
jgi:hypothetical protein